jgi:hypothetical protein
MTGSVRPGSRDPERASLWDQMKWSLLMIAITLVVAAIAIPILRWFGIGTSTKEPPAATERPR